MRDILDEAEADQIVKEILIKHRKAKDIMTKFLLDENGAIYRVHSYEPVTADEFAQHEAGVKEEVDSLTKLQSTAATLAGAAVPANSTPAPSDQPGTPVDNPPAVPTDATTQADPNQAQTPAPQPPLQ